MSLKPFNSVGGVSVGEVPVNIIDATGNIANVSSLTATVIAGTLATASQPNITSVGTLNSLSVTGNASVGNLSATAISGTLSTASQPNITGVGTLGSLNVTANISAGNLSATAISGTLSTAAQPNITSVGTLSSLAVAGNLTSANASLGNTASANYFVGNGSRLTNLSTVYGGEFHVSDSSGNDNNDGSLLYPVRTITKALTLVNGVRKVIIVHPGDYSDDITVTMPYTVLQTMSTGGNSVEITGTLTLAAPCSVDGFILKTVNITSSTGSGSVYLWNSTIKTSLTKSGSQAYVEINNCSKQVSSGIFITGPGTVSIDSNKNFLVTVNHASAIVTIKNCTQVLAPSVLLGTLYINDCGVFSATATSNAVTSSAGTVVSMTNCQVVTPAGAPARMSIAGFYSLNDIQYDKANSTLTGTSLNTVSYFQGINIDTATVNLTLSVTGNASVGNLSATKISGTLTTASQTNITTVGTLGNLSVTSNISAGNVKTDNLLYANGAAWDLGGNPGGSNIQVQFNDNGEFGGSSAFTFNKATNLLTLSGNASVGNLSATGISGTLSTAAQTNITSVGTLGSLDVTANISAGGIKTDTYMYANGAPVDFQQAGGSNTQIQFNNNESFGGSSAFTFDQGTNTVAILNDLTVGNSIALTDGSDGYVEATGNINLVANSNEWKFDSTGNLILPVGGVISESPSPTGLGSTVTITPQGGGSSTQQLQIYPTAVEGDHIHLTSGNLQATDIFLGDDGQYIRTSNTGGMVIGTGGGEVSGMAWNFDADGNIYAKPDNDLIMVVADTDENGYSIQQTITDGAVDVARTTLENGQFSIYPDLQGGYEWRFERDQLQVTNNSTIRGFDADITIQAMYAGGNGTASLQSVSNQNDPNVFSTFDATTSGANIKVYNGGSVGGTEYAWVFANDGDLAAPGSISAQANIAASGVKTDSYMYANGAPVDFQQAGGSNTQVQFNNDNDFGGSSNFTFNTATNVLDVTGNITGTNVQLSSNITVNSHVITDAIIGRTSGVTISATGANSSITLAPTGTGTVDVSSVRITNLATPNAQSDAATKQYVDDVAQGLNIHDAVATATPATLASLSGGTVTYNNGTAGVGATLITTGTFTLIDNVDVQSVGTRILVKDEANAAHNGVYVWSNITTLTRANDYNTIPEVEAGDYMFCSGGDTYAGTGWVQSSVVVTIGTDPIEFTQFSGAGTYSAGTGLTLDGTTFSITDTAVTTGSYGGGDTVATFTVNQQGQLTAAGDTSITANAANLSGTVLNSGVITSSLTSVGTLGTLAVTGVITVGTTAINSAILTTSSTVIQTLANIDVTTGVNGVEFFIKSVDSSGNKYTIVKLQAVTNGTDVDWVQYGGTSLGGQTGSLSCTITTSGPNKYLNLRVTPSSSNSTSWTTQFSTI